MSYPVFLFCLHNHQPVGNFASVFEKAFADCYRPLLAELARHPRFRFTVHFSGPLWEHMKSRETECWDLIRLMAGRGQAELLGGGFYEPLLAIIPEQDRLGQLRMMSRFLEENFGAAPRGAWLTERVWEPNLASTLSRAGLDYTLLDEEHFHYAGVRDLHTSYQTEDQGQGLRIFPIDKTLRYLIPFRTVEEVRLYLERVGDGRLAVLGDDGEKFGLWPGTHGHVYGRGWLKAFLELLENEDVPTMTLAQALEAFPPAKRVYLPPASYEEMMGWVLSPEEQVIYQRLKAGLPAEGRRFLRGGFFREFFLKYPESDHLHKRMLLASSRVEAHPDEEARRELYQGQCNDAYWHGIFGGLYLPHLREAAYNHLLRAEKRVPGRDGWQTLDLDLDGKPELVHSSPRWQLFFKPAAGGALIEADSLSWERNLTDVLARRKESYHFTPGQGNTEGGSIHERARPLPEGSEQFLVYDRRPRYSLLDHLLPVGATVEDVLPGAQREGDRPAADEAYDFALEAEGLVLERRAVPIPSPEPGAVRLRKAVRPQGNGFRVEWEIANTSERRADFLFASEWNFLVFEGEWAKEDKTLALFQGRARLRYPEADDLWHYPLQTLSQSEKGFDIIPQGVCFLPVWRLQLEPGQTAHLALFFEEAYDR